MIIDPKKPLINDIPNSWAYKKASELFSESKENNRPELKLYSVTKDRGIIPQSESNKRDISSSNREKYKIIKPNYIVYNTMRMWQGISAVSQNTGIVSPAYTVLKPIKNVNTQFIGYLFKYQPMINVFHRYSQGLVNDTLNLKYQNFKDILIPVPPINEQQKIAAILSSVDDAIEKTDQIIEQTETVKKGLMQELLTRGIDHTEFKDTPVGTIPKEWDVLNFKDVFDRITTKNVNNNQNVLTISGEQGLISQLEYFNKSVSSKNLKNYIHLKKGDFAYNKSYSNGYPLGAIKNLERYDEGIVSTLYICFRLKDTYNLGFYKYYFDSPYWHRQVYSIAPEGGRSHGLLNVGVKDFFEILIPVPPIEEQKKINEILYSVDQKNITENNKLENLQNIKQGLMQQLLTGRVRVKVDDSEEVLS